MTTMKAAVFHEVNKPLEIEEVELAPPQNGEALVKLASAGICHSDLHYIEGYFPWPMPTILGHEAAGVVEQVGEGVTLVQPGDHVILASTSSCGVCRYCAKGKPYLCSANVGGLTMRDGTSRLSLKRNGQMINHFLSVSSFAEYVVTPEISMVKVRKDAPLEKLTVIGCAVVTGIGAVINTARVKPGESVAVFGCGGVGLNVIQGANLAGAYPIIAVDTLDSKLALAEQFGATHLINSTPESPVGRIREITGEGVDYAFEVVGDIDVLGQAFNSIDRGGTAVMVGLPRLSAKYPVDTTSLFADKGLRGCAYGSINIHHDIPMLVDLYLAKRIKLDELVTREYPLEEINEALAAMKRGEGARSVITF